MEFPRIFNANLRLIWAKCYLRNRWLHCIQTWYDNLFRTTDWYSAIIIFHGANSLSNTFITACRGNVLAKKPPQKQTISATQMCLAWPTDCRYLSSHSIFKTMINSIPQYIISEFSACTLLYQIYHCAPLCTMYFWEFISKIALWEYCRDT